MRVEQQVIIKAPKVKLHWPDRWCSYCLQETQQVMRQPFEVYWCPSCNRLSGGRTEYIDTVVLHA